jgi:hypothetical protein
MSDTTANVTPLHTPAQRAAAAALVHYETRDQSHYLPLSPTELVAVAHLRGWAHFGPMCPICFRGAR